MLVLIGETGAIPQFDISHRVRLAREYAGMQQSELAEKTGLSRTSIANIERGSNMPRKKSIAAIASVTGVDHKWLAPGQDPVLVTETNNPGMG